MPDPARKSRRLLRLRGLGVDLRSTPTRDFVIVECVERTI